MTYYSTVMTVKIQNLEEKREEKEAWGSLVADGDVD